MKAISKGARSSAPERDLEPGYIVAAKDPRDRSGGVGGEHFCVLARSPADSGRWLVLVLETSAPNCVGVVDSNTAILVRLPGGRGEVDAQNPVLVSPGRFRRDASDLVVTRGFVAGVVVNRILNALQKWWAAQGGAAPNSSSASAGPSLP